ncbi:hypothetical protein ACFSND_04005 [Brevibacillus brevis]|uniref:hypothetical protein n=1 Tax=Brevibacillus brevis TaxID=1393 RepID=UPI003627C8FE
MAIKVEPAFLEFIRKYGERKNSTMPSSPLMGSLSFIQSHRPKHLTSAQKDGCAAVRLFGRTDAAGTITEAKLVDASGAAMISSDASISSHETGALLLFEIPFEVRSV